MKPHGNKSQVVPQDNIFCKLKIEFPPLIFSLYFPSHLITYVSLTKPSYKDNTTPRILCCPSVHPSERKQNMKAAYK